jgi:hypothetical protein
VISTDSFAALFARNRILVAAFVVVMTGLATWGYIRDKTQHNLTRGQREEQSDDSDDRLLREVNDQFELRTSTCFLVVEADDLFTPESVTAMRHIVREVEALDYVDRVFWLDELAVVNAFGLPKPLLPREDAGPEAFQEAKRLALEHPLVAGQLVSPDATTLLMPVAIDWLNVTPNSNAECSTQLSTAARAAAAEHPEADLQVRLTGSLPIFIAQSEAFKRNDRKFMIIGYVLTGIIAVILFRGLSAVLIVASAPTLAVFWASGLIRLLDINRNDLTNGILPVLVTMVGMTDGIHLMVYIRRLRAEGSSPLESACGAIRRVGLACLLTSVTTAIGFCSLLLAESPFIRDFGLACSVGVLASFAAVITIIPLACSTPLAKNVHLGQQHDIIGKGIERFSGLVDWIVRRNRLITTFAVLATIVCAVAALQLRPDGRRGNVLPPDSEAAQALEHCDKAFGGIEYVRVVVGWPAGMSDTAPEIFNAVKDVEGVIANEPLLKHPLSIRSIVESLPGDQADPAARMGFLHLMPPELQRVLYNPDQRRTLVTVRVQDIGLAKYNPVFDRVDLELAKLEATHPGFDFELTGDMVVGGRDLTQIVYDLAASLGTASLIIFIVITVVYRSVQVGLITVVPNMFPLVITAAVLYLFGGSLTVVSVCAFTVCIGIAVDDTIHFLTRFQYEASETGDIHLAIRRTFLGVGNALVMTTIILVTGFATVLTSELPAHRTFASMACATIAAALLADLLFFPAMLACFARKRDRRGEPGEAQEEQALEVV